MNAHYHVRAKRVILNAKSITGCYIQVLPSISVDFEFARVPCARECANVSVHPCSTQLEPLASSCMYMYMHGHVETCTYAAPSASCKTRQAKLLLLLLVVNLQSGVDLSAAVVMERWEASYVSSGCQATCSRTVSLPMPEASGEVCLSGSANSQEDSASFNYQDVINCDDNQIVSQPEIKYDML